MYCAVIGDIINSKTLERRVEIQKELKKVLEEINNEYDASIASKFTITLGDEFQGLLKEPNNLMDIIEKIKLNLYPIRIRFGIGVGNIITEINKEASIGADGPAYYNARKMIDEIRKAEKSKRKIDTDIKMLSEADPICMNDDLINVVFSLCLYIESKWTNRQHEVIIDFIKYKDNQRKAADRLGVKQSTVQRLLKNSGVYKYLHAKAVIQDAIIKMWRQADE